MTTAGVTSEGVAAAAQDVGGAWAVLEEIAPDVETFPARARLNGETIVVFKTKSGLRGTSRSCPHMHATMMQAELAANDTMVRCPLHVFTFRLSDGKGVNCAGFRIDVFDIREDNGRLLGRRVPSPSATGR